MINDLFADLAVTCMENNLSFDYAPHVGAIDIRTVEGNGKNLTSEKISNGYIKKWDHESPESTLNRMLKEVNEYLEGKQ
ncbi:hypothetical protein GCM10011409_21290 [Lentibacillus populi]|uniref:Uncharacterized protein n=1 Tax=Lentibacillus populi TaxID=1827502 RepID=A0A9W5X5K9_9BACI|nr:hypothetical protein [Lentibacillus populi]GGB43411.1 hypothetical protein GCM10011409_21290 [Lentibacillus populi]